MSELTKSLRISADGDEHWRIADELRQLCDEHERLEGLLLTLGVATEAGDQHAMLDASLVLIAEAVRLAKEKP